MMPYQITYRMGKYENVIIVQAYSQDEATRKAREHGQLPADAQVVSIEARA